MCDYVRGAPPAPAEAPICIPAPLQLHSATRLSLEAGDQVTADYPRLSNCQNSEL